jgi:hypothetical protein
MIETSASPQLQLDRNRLDGLTRRGGARRQQTDHNERPTDRADD